MPKAEFSLERTTMLCLPSPSVSMICYHHTKIWRPAWHLPLRFHQISTIHSVHSVYRQHKQYSSRESDVFQMHIFYSFEVLRSIQTGMDNQTKKSLQTCTQPMTIWAVIPYQISGDIFILE